MTESEVQDQITLHAPYVNSLLLRNNSGAFKDETGRLVRFGLGNVSKKANDTMKSSDLIGVTEVTITPEMVGKKVAIFTAIEVKSPHYKPTPKDQRYIAQCNFINLVNSRGGIGAVCKTKQEFENVIKDYRDWLVR